MEKSARTVCITTVLRARKPVTSSILEILGMTTSKYSAMMLASDHARVHARRNNHRLLVVLQLLVVEYGTKKSEKLQFISKESVFIIHDLRRKRMPTVSHHGGRFDQTKIHQTN
jgi:hypothetical protein